MDRLMVKRGDTFNFTIIAKDANEEAISGAAARFKTQIRSGGGVLYSDLIITETDTPGQYIFRALSTESWPGGSVLYTDIQYTDINGDILSSDTIAIDVRKDVTI